MPFRRNIPANVSGGAFLTAALLCLVLPLKWFLAALLAAAVHELFHLLALYACGGRMLGLSIGSRGASIQTGQLSRGRELLCALAGPVGGLMPLLFASRFPRLALCALVYSLYNLIPVCPLDGGRALSCAAYLLLSPKSADRVLLWVKCLCYGTLLSFGIYACFALGLGLLPLLPGILLIVETNPGKIPCKPLTKGVQ